MTVYAYNETEVKSIRAEFMKHYGAGEEGEWPTMADSSKMKFIPLIDGYIEDEEARESCFQCLLHQAVAKAGEAVLDLPMKDITTKKDYLQNKSIEQIIHEITTKTDSEIPLFKHITTKWVNRTEEMVYEVAVASALLDEAQEEMKEITSNLKQKYGAQVEAHFKEKNDGNRRWYGSQKRNYSRAMNDWDDELKLFITKTSNDDKLSKILIEGMEQLDSKRSVEGTYEAMQIIIPEKPTEDEKKSTTNNEPTKQREIIEIDQESTNQNTVGNSIGNLTELSDNNSYVQTRAWNEIALSTEFNCIPATEYEKRKTMNKLSEEGIEMAEIDRWKNKNWNKMDYILERCENNEYNAMKRIVYTILAERRMEGDEVEENSLTTNGSKSRMSSLAEDEERSLQMKLQKQKEPDPPQQEESQLQQQGEVDSSGRGG